MLFPTFSFLFIFLPIVFLLHESRPFQKINRQLFFLTVVSIIFVSFWEMRSLYIIVGMLAANLFVLHFLSRKKSKLWFAVGLAVNLLPLIYFKYTAFILSNLGVELSYDELKHLKILTLPLAISFYSFVALTYIVDTYRQKIPDHSPLRYSFFVTFFPHLIAGPIVHHSDLIPQIDLKRDRPALFFEGLVYLVIGFCKKIFIADPLGRTVDTIHAALASGSALTFADSASATLGYTLQLYFDFSGYSDMAVGLGLFFGYRLPINFNSPYLATSISNFWQRWHITLSRLMRDYVYFTLGGSRCGKTRHIGNLLVTMLVSGIWHGAGWTFILWGFLHGLIMCLEKIATFIFGSKADNLLPKPIKIFITFLFVNLLWVLFRAENIGTAGSIYKGLFFFEQFGKFSIDWLMLTLIALALLFMPNSHRIASYLTGRFKNLREPVWNIAVTAAPGFILGIMLCFITLYMFYGTTVDRFFYKKLPIERYTIGTDNAGGDFRSNIFSSPLLTYNGPKMVIVGSSYTRALGNLSFMHNGQNVRSASIGAGGNYLHIGLREALAVIDENNVETLVLGTSALNMRPINNGDPFKGQLFGHFDELGLQMFELKKYSEAKPIKISIKDTVKLWLSETSRYQFREFLFKLTTATGLTSFNKPSWKKEISWDTHIPTNNNDFSLLLEQLKPANQSPKDTANGSDHKFKWENRKAIEVISPGGDAYKAIAALSGMCKARNIRFVLYSTPTVSHEDAPHIYPAGFLEEYQEKMFELAKNENIEYYDFSTELPWDAAYMSDFIHPTPAARKLLHKQLINLVYGVKE